MSNAELLEYKRYLQKYVFAGWEAPDDLKEWVRLLERHIMHSDLMSEEAQLTDDTQNGGNAESAEALDGGKHPPQRNVLLKLARPCQSQLNVSSVKFRKHTPGPVQYCYPSSALMLYKWC